MMNKIFISDRPVFLFTKKKPLTTPCDYTLTFSNTTSLKKTIRAFEANSSIENMAIQFDSEKQKKEAIYKLYKVIEAAGGIVKNKEGKLLFILRHGKWDLPKGKIEKGEKEKAAALREVEEECGIKQLSLKDKFVETYHTYRIKDKNILKISHWYKMKYAGKLITLVPQLEEGITEAKWLNEKQIKIAMKNTYASIAEVMSLYLKK